MKLIDTSAWVEFFRRRGDPAVKHYVAQLVQADAAVYACPIYFEMLCGAKPAEHADLARVFSFCERVFFGPQDWEKAAGYERQLRHKGLTIPRNDVFIATLALRTGLPLVHCDRHFELIRDPGGLKLLLETVAPQGGDGMARHG
jgi:predicted nucleic acid-binding protein